MPTGNVTHPKLSDLIRDWAKQEGWPITVRPSNQYPGLYWVETEQLADENQNDPRIKALRGIYIGTVHNEEPSFIPIPQFDENAYFDATDPHFFDNIVKVIHFVFKANPLLDKSALPNVK